MLLVELFRRFPIIFIVGIFIVGGILLRAYLPGAAADLRVGDCFDEPADMNDVRDVQHRPCTDAHDAEVFAVLTHPAASGAAYPTEDGFIDFILDECVPAFDSYTGTAFDTHLELDIGYFIPVADGWRGGDRGVVCYAYPVSGQKLTASVRAAQ